MSDRFFIGKQQVTTTDASGKETTTEVDVVKKDSGEDDAFRPDLLAFATFSAPRRWGGKHGETWYSAGALG